MGLASGTQPLAFGHSADAAVDIEGLSVHSLFVLNMVDTVLISLYPATRRSSPETT